MQEQQNYCCMWRWIPQLLECIFLIHYARLIITSQQQMYFPYSDYYKYCKDELCREDSRLDQVWSFRRICNGQFEFYFTSGRWIRFSKTNSAFKAISRLRIKLLTTTWFVSKLWMNFLRPNFFKSLVHFKALDQISKTKLFNFKAPGEVFKNNLIHFNALEQLCKTKLLHFKLRINF